jgi:hypothetical protein
MLMRVLYFLKSKGEEMKQKIFQLNIIVQNVTIQNMRIRRIKPVIIVGIAVVLRKVSLSVKQ